MKYINFYIVIFLVNIIFSGCNIEGGSDSNSSSINITLKGSKKIYLDLGEEFIDPGAIAISKEDGNISNLIQISDINTSTIGEKNVVYSVVDSSGKSATIIRKVIVEYNKSKTPYDSNTIFDKDKRYVYFANPKEEEGGLNSVVKIDYIDMKKTQEVFTVGRNPHSIDRAGNSDKFYVRTQDSNSFDVVNFKSGSVEKTVKIEYKNLNLTGTNPRSIGAYNAKYNLQLLTGKHRPIVALINTINDEIVGVVGNYKAYNPKITWSGHAIWFNEDYFGILSKIENSDSKYSLSLYKVFKDRENHISIKNMNQTLIFETEIHSVERDLNPTNITQLRNFYAFGSSKIANNKYYPPYITKIKFDPKLGVIKKDKIAILSDSPCVKDNLAIAHHGKVTPNHKYIVAPISDGRIYFIDIKSMKIVKILDSGREKGLGAGHIEFSNKLKLGIVTNHYSNYLTILDIDGDSLKKYKILTEVKISEDSFDPNNKHLMQPHFAILSQDERYFYTADSHNGKFVRVDLERIKDIVNGGGKLSNSINELIKEGVLKIIDIGGVLEQSHS